jgi:hypothetical protein
MKQLKKMKQNHKMKNILLLLSFLPLAASVAAQEDSTKPEVTMNIHHLVVNNNFQYLVVETKAKVNNRWQVLKKLPVQLFLDSNSETNLIAKVQTDETGKAKAIIPANLKPAWDASATHKFIGVTADGTTAEAEITKAKILIDTANVDGARTVNVQVMKWEGTDWAPAGDVELRIGVKRHGGELKIGEDETYTTDSTGTVSAEFKRDSLPADEKGNLILVAKVEDNDNYGSLSIEKTVPWGAYYKRENNFGQRALWAARGKAPIWLFAMAYSIIIAVWGTLIYLILMIVKIKKIGVRAAKQTANKELELEENVV